MGKTFEINDENLEGVSGGYDIALSAKDGHSISVSKAEYELLEKSGFIKDSKISHEDLTNAVTCLLNNGFSGSMTFNLLSHYDVYGKDGLYHIWDENKVDTSVINVKVLND